MATHRTHRELIERLVVTLAFAVTLATNALANILPIAGQTTGAISDQYPTLFTPAGFTFSIWGVIYLGLTAYVVFQAFPTAHARRLVRKINPWFVVNCLANASWIFAWHYELIWASLAIMLVILGTLIRIFLLVSEQAYGANRGVRWFVRLPFSIYTAWIAVATIANVSVLQTAMGWDGGAGVAIAGTIVKLAIAGGIGATVLLTWRNRPFALVIAWAAFGIARNQADTPLVSGAAWVVAGTLLVMAAWSWVSWLGDARTPTRGGAANEVGKMAHALDS